MTKNLIIIAIILIFVASIVFLDAPTVQGVLSFRTEFKNSQNSFNEKEALMKTIEGLIEKYQINEEVLKNLDIILPASSDIPNLLVQIEALANAGGMMVNDISIAVVDEKEISMAETARSGGTVQEKAPVDYKMITINLMMSGDYNALKNFLRATEDNMRLIDVESVSFSTKTQGTSPLFDFNITLRTYYYAK